MSVGCCWLERLDLVGEIHIVQIPQFLRVKGGTPKTIEVSSHANTNLMTYFSNLSTVLLELRQRKAI